MATTTVDVSVSVTAVAITDVVRESACPADAHSAT